MVLEKYFERVYCVNLDRRPDRWEAFQAGVPKDWPFVKIKRVSAVDGERCTPPSWWKQGKGAWGCYKTHLGLIEKCLNENVNSVLLLEDDATFPDSFLEDVAQYLKHVPYHWGMLYLGGQHLQADQGQPKKFNDWVYQPFNVNRTHAWALHGRCMKKTYQYLSNMEKENHTHIDHYLGRMHQKREDQIFTPKHWLVGQAEGDSNIAGRHFEERFWANAENLNKNWSDHPFVAVIGLHSSGSSCCAGVLHHLGLHLGNHLVGYYGNQPNHNCGFEAIGLARFLERAIPLPRTSWMRSEEERAKFFKKWINEKRVEALSKGTIACGKHPLLCQAGSDLKSVCGDHLKVVHINRPLEESIKSLQKRCPKIDLKCIAEHQRWLWKGKKELISDTKDVLTIEYADLLGDPAIEVNRICKFLGIEPSTKQYKSAIEYVKPDQKHV
ncbi:MAG: glycosyl transferase family 25 [Blastopirellula sp.]|nr:MAG: glycosyl transferase family 25 [Blastopirellula sp.]